MNITNNQELVININGKTQLYDKGVLKKVLKDYEDSKKHLLLGGCANYERDNIEEEKEKILLKVYLAIPYSGMEESSYEQATKATMLIINELGHNVFSPITHSHPIAKLGVKGTWDYWQKIDYQYLDWADEMWVLIPKEGLDKVLLSTGVVAETKYAVKNNKKVVFIAIDNNDVIFI